METKNDTIIEEQFAPLSVLFQGREKKERTFQLLVKVAEFIGGRRHGELIA